MIFYSHIRGERSGFIAIPSSIMANGASIHSSISFVFSLFGMGALSSKSILAPAR